MNLDFTLCPVATWEKPASVPSCGLSALKRKECSKEHTNYVSRKCPNYEKYKICTLKNN